MHCVLGLVVLLVAYFLLVAQRAPPVLSWGALATMVAVGWWIGLHEGDDDDW